MADREGEDQAVTEVGLLTHDYMKVGSLSFLLWGTKETKTSRVCEAGMPVLSFEYDQKSHEI